MNITFLFDRKSTLELKKEDPALFSYMHDNNIGGVQSKKHVHFVGILKINGKNPIFFLPIGSDKEKSTYTARLTMSCLTRYAQEVSPKARTDAGFQGNLDALSTTMKLVQDFFQHSIYFERDKILTKTFGKIDWNKTISKCIPIFGKNNIPVYQKTYNIFHNKNYNQLLSQIQYAILQEISQTHGWWIKNLSAKLNLINFIDPIKSKRDSWISILYNILPRLYSQRAISLANLLIFYLEEHQSFGTEKYLFGINNFHTVWEIMLRETLLDVDPDWNTKLPKPYYILSDNQHQYQPAQPGMQTDIILNRDEKILIIDAKYYEASTINNVPGWPDICKQMAYEHAVRSLTDTKIIENIFIFPGRVPKFSRIEMKPVSIEMQKFFPHIRCKYINVETILYKYKMHCRDIYIY